VRRTLVTELFDLWLASDGLDLHAYQPPILAPASASSRGSRHLLACPVARWHATHGGAVTNLWHQEVELAEPVVRVLLRHLDGTRSLDALEDDAASVLADRSSQTIGTDGEEIVRAGVDLLARAGLLVG
jgi:hypothetical protein